ncbi:MAG TPA: hypothetical protein VEJ86_05620 [Candidatus Binataceae bacterium]|nr:hypothetical protein [Candidatus Binataceae bacterium]
MDVPGLDQRIAAYAATVAAGDEQKSESFVSSAALPEYRGAIAAVMARGPFRKAEPKKLALARMGSHYILKLRLFGSDQPATLQIRWRQEPPKAGEWMIASLEDLSGKRSPWSDIQHYSMERRDA